MDNSQTKNVIASRKKVFYGWYLVAASWIMSFLVCGTAVGIFFQPILVEFKLDRATLSLVSSIALLVFAALSPFLGRLIDRFGPRAMLFVCVTAQTLSSAINGLASSIWHIYIGRFLYELKPTHSTQVLINRWFVKKRGRALGIAATGIPLGTLVLSPLSQYLILIWGWRMTLFFWAGVTLVILLPLTWLIRNRPGDKGLAPDGELSATEMPIKSQGDTIATVAAASTGKSLAEAIKTGSFWLLSSTHLICGIGCGLMMTHTVIFATDLGYSAMIGASFLSVQGGVNLVGVLLTGHISDRMARNKVLSLSHLIRSISFVTLVIAILTSGGSLWMLYLGMALFGFGWFTTAPLVAGLVADLFGYRQMGTIIGIVMSFHMIGMAIGTYAGGITFQLTDSYLLIFIIQGILEFLAAIFAFVIKIRRH